MPQIPPEFQPLNEWSELAERIIEKHSEKFTGIDVKKIRAVVITNKERSESNDKLFEIKAVPDPIRMDCPYAYYIIFYQEDWSILENKNKLLLIAKTLRSIPLDDNGEMVEGKVNSFDLKDFADMIRTFGPDYLVKETVPDILQDDFKWID